MTAPRDPIEAPATLRGKHLLSELPDLIRGPWTPFREGQWTGTILAIEAAARDEGRQEAVRLLERASQMMTGQIRHRFMGACPDEVVGPDVRDPECEACSILDDVARHGRSSDPEPLCRDPRHDEIEAWYRQALTLAGRSSDPEPAPSGWSVEERQEDDGSWSIVSTVLPGLVVGADTREEAWAMWPEVVELWASTANDARVAAERGAVPALQATGEPPTSDVPAYCVDPDEHGQRGFICVCPDPVGATGEGERHE